MKQDNLKILIRRIDMAMMISQTVFVTAALIYVIVYLW